MLTILNLYFQDQLWRNPDSGLLAYSLALLNNVSYNVVEFAKSLVEWMSDKVMKSFEVGRNNPYQFKLVKTAFHIMLKIKINQFHGFLIIFHFRYCKLCHNLSELAKIPSPKVNTESCDSLCLNDLEKMF